MAFSAKGFSDYNTASSLKAEGVEIPGKVVNQRIKSGRRGAKTYILEVIYEPKAGDLAISREFEVSSTGYQKAEQEPNVQVRILPSDPQVAQLVGEESSGLFFIALGIAALIASVFMVFLAFKKDQPTSVAPGL